MKKLAAWLVTLKGHGVGLIVGNKVLAVVLSASLVAGITVANNNVDLARELGMEVTNVYAEEPDENETEYLLEAPEEEEEPDASPPEDPSIDNDNESDNEEDTDPDADDEPDTQAQALAAARTAMHSRINNMVGGRVGTDYTTATWAALTGAASTARTAVNAAASVAAVNAVSLSGIEDAIDNLVIDDLALAAAKAEMHGRIDDMIAAASAAAKLLPEWDAVTTAETTARGLIDGALKASAARAVSLTAIGTAINSAVIQATKNADNEAISAAYEAIKSWPGSIVTHQKKTADFDQAKALIQSIIDFYVKGGVTAVLVPGDFTAPIAGSVANEYGTNGSFEFEITLNKGLGTQQTASGKLVIFATEYDKTADNEAISDAKTAIQSASFTATQAEVTDAKQAEAKVQRVINELNLGGVTAVIVPGDFTAAIAGSVANEYGTNGSWTFTVTLNKGLGTQQTASGELTITATPYDKTADNAAISAARARVESRIRSIGTHHRFAADFDQAVDMIQSIVNELVTDDGVTLVLVPGDFIASIAGSVENEKGTNGRFEFEVTLNRGLGTEMVASGMLVIFATPYDKTADNNAISAAKTAIESAVTGLTTTQAEVANAEQAEAKVQGAINGLNLGGVTAVIVPGTFTGATAGTVANEYGTNGSWTFTVTLNKGLGTQQTASGTLTITATPYDKTADNEAISAAYNMVASAIEGLGTIQEYAADIDQAIASIQSIIDEQVSDDVTAVLVPGEFTAAIAGSVENAGGTNGNFEFEITLNKGLGTEKIASGTLTIYATEYVAVYTVTFSIENGTWADGSTDDKVISAIEYGSAFPAAPVGMTPAASHSESPGAWDTDPESWPSTVTANAAYTFSFSDINTYTVTFRNWNGSVLETQEVEHGSAATAPSEDPVKGGHTFTGWDVEFDVITGELDVTAEFEINKFTVTFLDWNGDELKVLEDVIPGSDVRAKAPTPTRDDHTFTGWSEPIDYITGDLTVTAQYTRITHTVEFFGWDGMQNGVIDTQVVNQGEAAQAPADPERDGYTFTGWYPANFSNITGPLTVSAQYAINIYTVEFVDWDGTELKSEQINHDSDAIAPADPEREGYTFTGWDVDFSNITGPLTVTAVYAINKFTVTFLDWEGEEPLLVLENVEYNSDVTGDAPTPTREGHTFTGWSAPIDSITSDLTVRAEYEDDELNSGEELEGFSGFMGIMGDFDFGLDPFKLPDDKDLDPFKLPEEDDDMPGSQESDNENESSGDTGDAGTDTE